MATGQCGYTERDRATGKGQGELTILRQPMLSDVQVAEHFKSCGNRGCAFSGKGRQRMEYAIDPQANAQVIFFGLKMNVGSPLA